MNAAPGMAGWRCQAWRRGRSGWAARGGPRYALFDLAGQQLVWWSAVGLVLTGHPLLATVPAVALVAVSAWLNGLGVLALAIVGALVGFSLDTALVRAGALRFPGDPGGLVTTPWMVGLWASFGVAFAGSMRWLCRRGAWTAMAFGAVAGVLAYRSGASLGVLAIGPAPRALVLIGSGWSLAMLVLRAAGAWLEGPSSE